MGVRKRHISQAGLVVGPLLAMGAKQHIAGKDVIWFIDNAAVLSALVRAASPVEDSSRMALVAALGSLAAVSCGGFEYAP